MPLDVTVTFSDDQFASILDLMTKVYGSQYPNTNQGIAAKISQGLLTEAQNYSPSASVQGAIAAAASADLIKANAITPTLPAFAGFSLSAAGVSIAAGSSGTVTLTATLLGAFAGTITFGYAAPTGITATFSPTTRTSTGTTTVTVSVTSGTAPNAYTLALFGTSPIGSNSLSNVTLVTVTVTGGGGGGTVTNGPFESTQPGAMTVGTGYAFAFELTVPVLATSINWWSIWFVDPSNAPTNSSGVIPAPNSAALDVQPWNTGSELRVYESGGGSINWGVGSGSTGGSGRWDFPLTSATLVLASGVLTLTLPTVTFRAAAGYHLYMRANYNIASGASQDIADMAGNIWWDLGPFNAS